MGVFQKENKYMAQAYMKKLVTFVQQHHIQARLKAKEEISNLFLLSQQRNSKEL